MLKDIYKRVVSEGMKKRRRDCYTIFTHSHFSYIESHIPLKLSKCFRHNFFCLQPISHNKSHILFKVHRVPT
ncbi:hypothetical protein Lalb_Chr23g0273891 [Lupinus albus]|uniref:Uncharacterized protein n=1 Tax=Lupinus albus TaxID=3870 RepID=A0A6A4N566_LUPAL|nr:hypothetical protein Lalb_Chr23g0273891 [Lupinus albus]